MSDGSSQVVTASATWTSSNPTVAFLSSSTIGRLTGSAHGVTTLLATYQGRTAQKNVSSVNNYGGQWTGTYVLNKCDQSGVFAGWCTNLGGVGAVLPFTLSLNQALSNDRTQVSGTLALGSLSGNISGNVTSDGRLVIGGSFNVTAGGIAFTIQIGGWDTHLTGSSMAGGWASNLSAIGATGNAYQEQTIVQTTHVTVQDVVGRPAPAISSFSSMAEVLSRMK